MKTQLVEIPHNNGIIRGIQMLSEIKNGNPTLFVHGFERCTTTEKKFKVLAQIFTEKVGDTLRLDFLGCGLSDGNFRNTTISGQQEEFMTGFEYLKKQNKKINIVAHSLGACIVAGKIEEIKDYINKIILIAPALNQKELLRYWFVTGKMKKINPDLEITWDNFREYLDESEFQADYKKTGKTTKINFIDPAYFIEASELDFSNSFENVKDKILHIHGDNDVAVPISSLNTEFSNQIIVTKGDHDLEKPDLIDFWTQKALEFILK